MIYIFSKRKTILRNLFAFCILTIFGNCLKESPEQYRFWKTYDNLQNSIQNSAPNPIVLRALYGNFQEDNEDLLRKTPEGNFEINIGAKSLSPSTWEVDWNPEPNVSFPYESKTTYSPIVWGEKPLYQVQRKVKSNWSGFFPSNFFQWLSDFHKVIVDENSFDRLKKSSNNLQFLCDTFLCDRKTIDNHTVFSVTFTENTKKKFPGFFKRSGGALEKAKLDISIVNTLNPKENIRIFNIDKTLSYQFPSEPMKSFFLDPANIEITSNIEINSFGIRVFIEKLVYRISLSKKDGLETLKGRFVSVQSQEITGRFLYFIPTGIVDFFIPGNLNQYLKDALTLLVYGTQGNGGNHFQATYQKTKTGQINHIQSYSEIQRKRFSLFGASNSDDEKGNFLFFSAWEEAMMKDLQPHN